MLTAKRITQQDVARAAGVNRATVSLALSGHPAISAATRTRIRALADELGYRPDPMLSALACYRNNRRPAEVRGTAAWIVRSTADAHWQTVPRSVAYYESARKHAERHGYRLEVLDLGERGLTWTRAGSILDSRGIRGALLCLDCETETAPAISPWKNVACITVGFSAARPLFHSVAPAQFHAAFRATQEMLARGYRRIGLVLTQERESPACREYLGGYLTARELAAARRLPPLALRDGTDFYAWVMEHEPDALVVENERAIYKLQKHELDGFGLTGLACLALDRRDSALAGVWQPAHSVGEAAMDMLVRLMNHSECGAASSPHRVLIDGEWLPGATLSSEVQIDAGFEPVCCVLA